MSQECKSPVLHFIDFLDQTFRGQEKARENISVCVAYACFTVVSFVITQHFSDRDFSTVLTAGSGVQCFGFYLLLQKTRVQQSVAGISGKTLEMYVLVLLCRLSSTLFKNGYLPVCRSGDFVYQVADIASLLLVLQLLYCLHKKYKATHQKMHDSLPIWNALPGCILAAVVLHGDLNHAPFYDVMWTISMNIDTVAMLPQLYMLVKKGGEVEALTANYVAALFFCSACKLAFWSYGYREVGDNDNLSWYHYFAGVWVVVAHVLQVLLSADFMYHYFCGSRSAAGGGVVVLPPAASYDV